MNLRVFASTMEWKRTRPCRNITQHHLARLLLKEYRRPPCAPSFIKLPTLRILQARNSVHYSYPRFIFHVCKDFYCKLEIRYRKNLAKLQRVSGENKGKKPKGKNMTKKLDRKKMCKENEYSYAVIRTQF